MDPGPGTDEPTWAKDYGPMVQIGHNGPWLHVTNGWKWLASDPEATWKWLELVWRGFRVASNGLVKTTWRGFGVAGKLLGSSSKWLASGSEVVRSC